MRFIFIFFLVFLATATLAQENSEFFEITGIPVLEGLNEAEEARLVFDKPEGRIVHAQFGGSVSGGEVFDFYRETLFQLGWVLDNGSEENSQATFTREGERLTITITGLDPLEITLDLGPAKDAS